MLAAATEILKEQGLREMSIDMVAARAGVSKATIYRWWRSKAELALDTALADARQQIPMPDTGTLVGDLRVRARATARAFGSPKLGPAMAALIGEAQSDAEDVRRGADEYAVNVLVGLEGDVVKTLQSIKKGIDLLDSRRTELRTDDDNGVGPDGLEEPGDERVDDEEGATQPARR